MQHTSCEFLFGNFHFSSVTQSCPTLQPHILQHARLGASHSTLRNSSKTVREEPGYVGIFAGLVGRQVCV